jgi:8-oxo-dGTP diphosphatase
MPGQTHLVAAAVIRRDDEILLVCQQGPDDPEPNWALPSGVVKPGEMIGDALVREVREETGLAIDRPRKILSVSQMVSLTHDFQSLGFLMEVEDWVGSPSPTDPDGLVLEARFMTSNDAIKHLTSLPWPFMREPAIAAVQGGELPGTYRAYYESDGKQQDG